MEFTIHPYNGEKTVEQVMLVDGSIVDWLLTARGLTGPAARIATYIQDRLMPQIDAKPIARPCAGCGGQARYLTAYRNNATTLIPWCEECDPYSLGAVGGRLNKVATYKQALAHARDSCGGGRGVKRAIAKAYAGAKGTPSRVTEIAAEVFFR